MNLRDLEYFVAVAELRHFGRAAERCFVSQPTLSGQVKKLEAELGVTLLERTNRRVMVTDAGREILASARRILAEVEQIQDLARGFHDPLAGRFRLGAFPTVASFVFPDLVPRVVRDMPDLRLVLVEEKTEVLLDRLRAGTLDAAVLALPVEDPLLVGEVLFEDRFRLAVPPGHPLAKRRRVTQDCLAGARLLLLEEGHCLRDQALALCAAQGIGEEPDLRATGLETLRWMVKAGTGITLMPEVAIREGEEGIVYVPFADPAPRREVGLFWRKTSARQAVLERLTLCLKAP